jgi:hypothetical protein
MRRGGRGDLIPVLTLSWDGARNRIGGGGQREVVVLGVAARWSLGRDLCELVMRCGAARTGQGYL